jgi:hypothetical protein
MTDIDRCDPRICVGAASNPRGFTGIDFLCGQKPIQANRPHEVLVQH